MHRVGVCSDWELEFGLSLASISDDFISPISFVPKAHVFIIYLDEYLVQIRT